MITNIVPHILRSLAYSFLDQATRCFALLNVVLLLHRHSLQVPGDVDADYRHLPVRVLKLWEHLGLRLADECEWYMKADPDTYINLIALSERLSCFDSGSPLFLGAVHAAVPPRHLQEQWPALFFGQGGCGYIVSRGLVAVAGEAAGPCLESTMRATEGSGWEDLLFAMCLRHRGVHVENYGFLVPGGQPWGADELAQEFVVNFHQAYDALLSGSGGDPLVRSPYWDAQPPPLHGCLLVAHPVESPGHLGRVHAAVLAARRREVSPLGRPRSCLPAPLALARQAEVRIRAPGGSTKQFWSSGLLAGLDRCLRRRPSPRCEWRALSGQCLGLSLYEPGRTAADCASACCSSGDACEVFQFNIEEGCWLGSRLGCPEQGAAEPGRWEGAVKSGA